MTGLMTGKRNQLQRLPGRRAAGVLLLSLLVLAFSLNGAPDLRAQSPYGQHAGLVIQFGDGSTHTACVDLGSDGQATGEEVLQAAGFPLIVEYSSLGIAVCKIDSVGCNYPEQPCWCQCQGSPCIYWAYHHLVDGQWQYSGYGAASYTVRPGDVEGWAWGEGTSGLGAEPPVIAFDEICVAPTATATPTRPPTATPTHTPTATNLPTATPTWTATWAPTDTPPPTATWTPQPTFTSTWTPSPTAGEGVITETSTATPTESPTATEAPTEPPQPVDTPVSVPEPPPPAAPEGQTRRAGQTLAFLPLIQQGGMLPTPIPEPTATPVPTATPAPSPTVVDKVAVAAAEPPPDEPVQPPSGEEPPPAAGSRWQSPRAVAASGPANVGTVTGAVTDSIFLVALVLLLAATVAGARQLRRRGMEGRPESRGRSPMGRGKVERGREKREGVHIPFASLLVYALAVAIGLAAFLYPFLLPAVGAAGHSGDGPLLVMALVALCFVALLFEIQNQAASTKLVALLGILVSINAILRFVEVGIPGPGGFSPVFFLIVLTGYVYGGRFGFLMGALTLLVSALVTGGVGPWLPGQMFVAGWVGLTAPLMRPAVRLLGGRAGSRTEVVVLAAFGGLWGLGFGALMNLWFWPFMTGPATQHWEAGLGLADTVRRYLAFYLATSLVWDVMRVAGNVLLILAFGAPTLRALRRFRQRFDFDYLPAPASAPAESPS